MNMLSTNIILSCGFIGLASLMLFFQLLLIRQLSDMDRKLDDLLKRVPSSEETKEKGK